MRKYMIAVSAAVALVSSAASPAIPRDEAMEREIAKLISEMTLEEKVGQMCELEIGVLGSYNPATDANFRFDETRTSFAIADKKVEV